MTETEQSSNFEETTFTNIPHDTLIYYSTPSTLLEITLTNLVLHLWRFRVKNRHRNEIPTARWFTGQNLKCTDILRVVSPIQPIIDDRIKTLGAEIKTWMDFHVERIFYECDVNIVVYKSLDDLVCLQDGTLDYIATARNLLVGDKLTDDEKYRIACTYCFRDIIELMWPSVYASKPKKSAPNTLTKQIVAYWDDMMLYELRDQPFLSYDTVERHLIAICCKFPRIWTSVEYFFGRLDATQQIQHMIDLIEMNAMYAVYLLPQLDAEQILQVMNKKGVVLWFRFSREAKYYGYALQTWYYVRNIIGEYSFLSMIKLTVEEQLVKIRINSSKNKLATRLLSEMWISAPANLKDYVIDRYAEDLFAVIFECDRDTLRVINKDTRFLLDVLSDLKSELRSTLWSTLWTKMLFSVPSMYLDELTKLCLQHDDKIAEFKTSLVEDARLRKSVLEHCNALIKCGSFIEFKGFLRFCAMDTQRQNQFQRDVLEQEDVGRYIFGLCSMEIWAQFRVLVDNIYDPEKSEDYKMNMIFSQPLYGDLNEALDNGRWTDVRNFVESFLNSDSLADAKEKFIQKCRCDLFSGRLYDFGKNDWQDFLEWCLHTDKDIFQFKTSLCIDDIFETSLSQEIHVMKKRCDFKKLGNFLSWYCLMEHSVKEYKTQKLQQYGGADAIKKAFMIEDDSVVEATVAWLMDQTRNENKNQRSSASCFGSVWMMLRQKFTTWIELYFRPLFSK